MYSSFSVGTHPELLHLHAELSKRRDKRLELASRRRDYEVANVTKRRRLDEEGVWSWWKVRHMVSSTLEHDLITLLRTLEMSCRPI